MKQKLTAVGCVLAMAILILDTPTILTGMESGLQVCMQTLIPALFPFLVVSVMLNAALSGSKPTVLRPLARLLKIPENALLLLLIGILGGYPVGAQVTAQACRDGRLHRHDGQRMLAFCSNAGPAFLFGMGYQLIGSVSLCFALWAIHLISALCVALLTPCDAAHPAENTTVRVVTLPQALRAAIGIMATICGWVVLFRVALNVAQKWCLRSLSERAACALYGILELANGCCMLSEIDQLGLRLTIFACILGFGGLCVYMQTRSVCEGLDMQWYLPGKCCQAAISFLLCIPTQLLLAEHQRWFPGIQPIVCCCAICVFYHIMCRKRENSSSISIPSMV